MKKLISTLAITGISAASLVGQSVQVTNIASQLWEDETFVKEFLGSYGFLAGYEPPISDEEKEALRDAAAPRRVELAEGHGRRDEGRDVALEPQRLRLGELQVADGLGGRDDLGRRGVAAPRHRQKDDGGSRGGDAERSSTRESSGAHARNVGARRGGGRADAYNPSP